MNKENYTISSEGVDRLEYAVNYLMHNMIALNYMCIDMSVNICNLDGNEVERANSYQWLNDRQKINALANTIGDMLEDSTVLLEAVIGELYAKENAKIDDNIGKENNLSDESYSFAWERVEIEELKKEFPECFAKDTIEKTRKEDDKNA